MSTITALEQLNDCIEGLFHLGPNVITFRTLLYFGPNVITSRTRTLLHLGKLLHLGLRLGQFGLISSKNQSSFF